MNAMLLLLLSACLTGPAEPVRPVKAAESYDQYIEQGRQLLEKNNAEKAAAAFSLAIAIDPQRLEGHYGLGVSRSILCHSENRYCQEAVEELSLVLKADPTYGKAYYNRGVCNLAQEFYEEAVKDFDKAIEKDANDPDFYTNRGVAQVHMGNTPAACEDFQKAQQLGGKRAGVLQLQYCKLKK